ncbi:MAG: MBL fold metallo-hydrolase [Candidatus Ranarchaeia archaeon]
MLLSKEDNEGVYIQFLGGCKEVGGSGVLICFHGHSVLIDYGMYLNSAIETSPEPVTPPLGVHTASLDSVVVTHAHLDHSGSVPLLFTVHSPELLATPLTYEIAGLLIADMMKLNRRYLPFDNYEIEKMQSSFSPIYFNTTKKISRNFSLQFFDSGHIPGGVSVLVTAGEKRIFYTSDFNLTDTRLLRGARPKLPPLDTVITESTYATVDHPDYRESQNMIGVSRA